MLTLAKKTKVVLSILWSKNIPAIFVFSAMNSCCFFPYIRKFKFKERGRKEGMTQSIYRTHFKPAILL